MNMDTMATISSYSPDTSFSLEDEFTLKDKSILHNTSGLHNHLNPFLSDITSNTWTEYVES